MLSVVFRRPKKKDIFISRCINELMIIGLSSLPIVVLMSTFMGGVIALQTASNMTSPLLPAYTIGYITQNSTILEFSPTIISLILAGKVGSNIASEIGTMRVTEQIDALEIMGVNSLNYLVFPKIIALLTYPFLIAIAMFLGIFGGLIAGVYGGFVSLDEFIRGLQEDFIPFHLVYAFVKTYVFAFILATVPAWHGYYMKGGALEVGKASTKSFVWTSVLIILANYIITQLLLS